jgi:ribosomal protein L19
MSSDLLRSIEEQQLKEDIGLKSDLPQLRVGDDVQVHFRIVEGDRERIQLVRGTVMRIRQGGGANANFTVRRIASHGIGGAYLSLAFPAHRKDRGPATRPRTPVETLLPARPAGQSHAPEREALYPNIGLGLQLLAGGV